MKPRLHLATRGGARAQGCRAALAALFALASAACSLLPRPQPDPTRYFVLSSSGAPAAAPAGAPALSLPPVEVASYLRKGSLIVRRGSNEIEFRDLARWGEPLEQGVGRVLREELLARGVAATPALTGRAAPTGIEQQLSVRVLACEGAAEGTVLFHANWELSRLGPTPSIKASGEYRASGLRWDGKDEASLTAQFSSAVGGLAAEIAGAAGKR